MTQALNIDQSVFARRKRANKIGLVLSMMAMGLGMIFLVGLCSLSQGFLPLIFICSLLARPHPAQKEVA